MLAKPGDHHFINAHRIHINYFKLKAFPHDPLTCNRNIVQLTENKPGKSCKALGFLDISKLKVFNELVVGT